MRKEADLEITDIELTQKIDYDGQPDYIGKFTDTWESGAIVRTQRGRNEYPMRYFVSANNVCAHWRESWVHCSESEKAATIAKYGSLKAAMFAWAHEDMKRLEAFGRTWEYIGITCLASIRITFDTNSFTVQVYDSLYGVENDSKEGILEVEKELMNCVQINLIDLGFSLIETERALRTVRRVGDYS